MCDALINRNRHLAGIDDSSFTHNTSTKENAQTHIFSSLFIFFPYFTLRNKHIFHLGLYQTQHKLCDKHIPDCMLTRPLFAVGYTEIWERKSNALTVNETFKLFFSLSLKYFVIHVVSKYVHKLMLDGNSWFI